MSLFGRPRVESRVFVRALPIMPDRNEKLISYVPTIQSYTGHPFFKKKKKKKEKSLKIWLQNSLAPCHFSCFAGAQQATPQEGYSYWSTPQSRGCPAPPHLHPCINLILWAHVLLHLPNCTSRCG